jgi:hypothetical protein
VDAYRTYLDELTQWVPSQIEVPMVGPDGLWTSRVYTPRDPDWPQILERFGPGVRKRLSKLAAGELSASETLLTAWAELEAYDGLDSEEQDGRSTKARRRNRREAVFGRRM